MNGNYIDEWMFTLPLNVAFSFGCYIISVFSAQNSCLNQYCYQNKDGATMVMLKAICLHVE